MDTLLQVPPAAIDDDDERTNFALLQVCPDEALPIPGEPGEGVDVIAISASRERLEQLAADYQQRFQAATEEFDTWDKLVGRGSEWSEALDRKLLNCWFGIASMGHWSPARAGGLSKYATALMWVFERQRGPHTGWYA